jgi:hypothetical protein
MIWYIVWFIIGFILGSLIMWIYGQITDKVQMAKTGYSLGKMFLIWIISKFKKS